MPDGGDDAIGDHQVHARHPIQLVAGCGPRALRAPAGGAVEIDDHRTMTIVNLATERQQPFHAIRRDPALLHAGTGVVRERGG